MKRIRIAASAAVLAVCSAALTTGAAAAVNQTQSCTDGAKHVWRAKAVWEAPYVAADGTTRARVDYMGWTTAAQNVTTKVEVKTSRSDGTVLQALTNDSVFDYNAGATWYHRNPRNPLSAPGGSKVTMVIGARGATGCKLTFVQPSAPTATPIPSPTPSTPPSTATEAAVAHGWGTPFASDEFTKVGAPASPKWSMYKGSGHAGRGQRQPAQWSVNGSYARATGNSVGTTGGMSFKPDRGSTSGRWEVRMRVPQRDSEYHPVLILWPDAGRVAANHCQEVDFSESTSDIDVNRFFLHTGCSGQQASASKSIDMKKWHNYAVEWTSSHVTGYIDGVKWFQNTTASDIPRAPAHLTVQLDWFPDGTATSASYLDIDWARAYRL